jgi:hypothetical protein
LSEVEMTAFNISHEVVRLPKSLKNKLSDAGIRTLEGVARYTILRLKEKVNLSVNELMLIERELRYRTNRLPTQITSSSIVPQIIVRVFWEEGIFTWKQLTMHTHREIFELIKKSKTRSPALRAVQIFEHMRKRTSFSPRWETGDELLLWDITPRLPEREIENYLRKGQYSIADVYADHNIEQCVWPKGKLYGWRQALAYHLYMHHQKLRS